MFTKMINFNFNRSSLDASANFIACVKQDLPKSSN